ncbi:MAG: AAA family ATPase [Kiritimatiellia bacterium]|jgi:AAA15 family ATPase/GTPase
MLIDFEVGNYLSFKDPVRLSMIAVPSYKEHLEANTIETEYLRLLKSAAIYGANASGKSNLIAALKFMRRFVLSSSKDTQVKDEIPVTPFLLDTGTESAPSHFEIDFIQNGTRYCYGFDVDRKAVRKEWLFRVGKTKGTILFLREDDGIDVREEFREGAGLEERTRDNALFLSVVAQFNGKISAELLKWFADFGTMHGLNDQALGPYTAECLQDADKRTQLIRLIKNADVGITDLVVNEVPFDVDDEMLKFLLPDLTKELRSKMELKISTVHQKYHQGEAVGLIPFDFDKTESAGTKKFLHMAAPLLDCLDNGYVVAIDELDAKLHPLLTKAIVGLFNSQKQNPKGAQLIFVTHDTNLLEHGKLRRDQIWFTEKDRLAATALYSLAEFKLPNGSKIRKDAALEANYIRGRYGAIPYLGDFGNLLKEANHGEADQN